MSVTDPTPPRSRWLGLGYAFAFALLAINVFVTLGNLRTLSLGLEQQSHAHDVIVGLNDLFAKLRDAETGQRGYLLTNNEEYLDPYLKSVNVVDGSLTHLTTLTQATPQYSQEIADVSNLVEAKLRVLEHTIDLQKSAGSAGAMSLVNTNEGKNLMDRLRVKLNTLLDREIAHRRQVKDNQKQALWRTIVTFSVASFVAFGLLIALHFLNERNTAEQRTAARWYTTTLRSIGDAVIATDAQGRVTFMNPTAQALTGWNLEEAHGKLLEGVLPLVNETTGKPVDNPVQKVLRENIVVGLANHTELVARDGSRRPIEDSAAPILDNGVLKGVVLVFHDVTAERAFQNERDRMLSSLREGDRFKDEFLAMLAHELRNPLGAILNAVTVTSRTELRENVEWSMDVISRQVGHLTRLIDDLLDVARISRGKIDLRREAREITAILNHAVETVRPLLEERRHTIDLALSSENLWANVDPTRFEQIVVNLLANAAKYTEDGGKIQISAEKTNEHIVISVKDSGIGIAPESLPKMFELFAQGNRSLARSEGGLGIGLTVVKNLVEMHGGEVVAQSEGIGKGSHFTVRIPAVSPLARVTSKGGQPLSNIPKTSSRILVVDDNIDTANGMAKLLELFGHRVSVAHTGPESIEAARVLSPEVILLDIGLPGMNGYEVAAKLRCEDCCRDAVIIAVSGYGQEEDRRRSREAGFDHHLVKPVDADVLVSIIANV